MSADNGIYILQTKDGFRVAHAQAIDNIYFEPNADGWNPYEVWGYFHQVAIHRDHSSALNRAWQIQKDMKGEVLEYGISSLLHPNLEFPKFTLAEYEQYIADRASKWGQQ